jgi:putative ATPase
MHEFGYGKGYRYAHNEPGHVARGMAYLPEELGQARYYEPGTLGIESDLARRHAAQRKDPGGPASDH